jgi:hypothetical protein
LIFCRSTRISASSFALDLKSEAKTPKISLSSSVIRARAYPVRSLRLRRIEFSVHTSVPDPLVDPRNPPHHHQAFTTAHPTRTHHRMVALAKSPSSRSAPRPSQKRNATVTLGDTVATRPKANLEISLTINGALRFDGAFDRT